MKLETFTTTKTGYLKVFLLGSRPQNWAFIGPNEGNRLSIMSRPTRKTGVLYQRRRELNSQESFKNHPKTENHRQIDCWRTGHLTIPSLRSILDQKTGKSKLELIWIDQRKTHSIISSLGNEVFIIWYQFRFELIHGSNHHHLDITKLSAWWILHRLVENQDHYHHVHDINMASQ